MFQDHNKNWATEVTEFKNPRQCPPFWRQRRECNWSQSMVLDDVRLAVVDRKW